jgi:hypothetical protein
MAYSFGTGVQAKLGATNYTNYLRGALTGAMIEAEGGAAIGKGIQNALSSIGVGVQKYMKNKEEKLLIDEATDTIVPILDIPAVRKQYGIAEDATPEAVRESVKKQVKVFGPAASLQLAREARQSAAFQVGIGAVPETITQTVEEKVPTFLTPDVNIYAPTSSLMNVPEQSVENFMRTGKITAQAPAMAIDMVSKQPAATAAAPEAPEIKPVPKNIEPYFAFNAQTGSLVATSKLEQDTLTVRSELKKLEQEEERINSELRNNYTPGYPYAVRAIASGVGRLAGVALGGPLGASLGASLGKAVPVDPVPFIGEDVTLRNQRLAEIEQQKAPLKNKSIELDNARQYAADFGKQPDKKPSVEETASNVIDRSLRFAEEVNLDPVDKNQWIQMKTVLKDIPRKATDGEKIAAFVKAYGDIAPIDSGVYFKMKQLFDTTPVITDLGGGNQLVTAGGQSFLNKANEKGTISATDRRLNNQEGYAELLVIASQMGLDAFRANSPDFYQRLQMLHSLYGKQSSGIPLTIKEAVDLIYIKPTDGQGDSMTSSTQPASAPTIGRFTVNPR